MGPARRIALVVTLLAFGLTAAATVPAGGSVVQADVPTDATAMDARLTTDGDATWTITYRVALDTEDRRTAFAQLEADLAANASAYRDRFRDRLGATIANAEATTGRSMALTNLTVSTSRTGVPDAYGLLTYRFRWTNFAAVEDDRLEAGDALAGLFLDEATSLTVVWPEDYDRSSATPSPAETGDRSVTWRGPQDFGPGEPRVVVAPAGGLPVPIVLAGPVLAAVIAGGALAWRRRAPGSGDGLDEGSEATPAAPDAPTDGPPDELLSNEERVIQLLEGEGGRIKQQQIAERLEWTDAKTSQVVGDLREADEVETFRIGRENVVTLPDHEL
jgi:hypothetical protein